jgi:hypothetical protein
MKSSELDLAFLSTIPLRNILKYFQSYDWLLVEPSPFTEIAIMRKNIHEEQEEILIPRDQSFADYNERIFDAIASLAKYENKVLEDIIPDLLSIG